MKKHRQLPRQKARFVIVFLATAAFFIPISEARIFTSAKDGRTLEGKVVGATDDAVRLQIGARHLQIPLSALIEADRRYIELWKIEEKKTRVPDLKVEIRTGSRKRRDPAYYSLGYYDASFSFEIRIENDERDFDVEGAEGTLIVIGENCVRNYDDYVVMQKKTVPLTIKAREKYVHNCPEVQFRYAQASSYQYGYKYHSYIFQIKNSAGKVVYTKVMAPRFGDLGEEILKFKEEDKFDAKGKAVKQSTTFR